MRKIMSFVLLLVSLTMGASEYKMADVFVDMPDSLMPLLTYNNRKDMADFYANKMQARIRNQFNEMSELKALTDDYLLLELSAKSQYEMKLLQTADSVTVIAFIHTASAPGYDSQVTFYNTDWQRLEWMKFPSPTIEEFWSSVPDSLRRDAEGAMLSLRDLKLVRVGASPEDGLFTLTLHTDELEEDEKKAAKQCVHPLQYVWNGSEFKKK